MGWIILAGIIGLVGILALVGGILGRDTDGAGVVIGGGAVAIVLAGGVVFFASLFTVGANQVGIVTSFGHPVGTVQSGAHLMAPWDKIDTYSTQVQVTTRNSNDDGDKTASDCVQVNLKGGAQACADMTIRYVINARDAVDLWKRYGDFDTVRDKLLRSATDNAAKLVYGQYAPQDAISGDALPGITKQMTAELTHQLADSGLTLVAVAPGQVHLPASVQERIDALLNAQNATTEARLNEAKNEAQAKANEALANSLTTPILEQQCIQAAEQIKPAIFNCFPGSATTGTPLVNVGH